MSLFSPQNLASLSDCELADRYYETIEIDPEAEGRGTKAIIAEIDRRSVSDEQLCAAWNRLAAEKMEA